MENVSCEWVTVTYAMYEDAPIACQGDDDQKKIQVITAEFARDDNVHDEALRRSLALSRLHGKYVQVWNVAFA
ncbi:MAG: hypothetical protein HYS18_14590 [Burkholderiales bacterium]|nr:hypothetical protein [Burkholderiales bacterium]